MRGNIMDMFKKFPNGLRRLRVAAGLTQEEAAEKFGYSKGGYLKVERGERRLSEKNILRAQSLYGVSAEEIMSPDVPRHSQRNDSTQLRIVPLSPSRPQGTGSLNDVNMKEKQYLTGNADLPIYPSAEAGNGAIIIDPSPIDHVPRPLGLEHEKDAFGVLVIGECMLPEFKPGEYAFIHPRKPPVRGSACLLTTEGVNGQWLGSLKSFIRNADKEWIVEQHNPQRGQSKQLRFSKDKWPKCLRVVGKYEGR
jgi:transcriptional regulator with XRE-family HTH domain